MTATASKEAPPLIDGVYDIIDPETVKMVPRDNFITGLCGEIVDETSIEKVISELVNGGKAPTTAHIELGKYAAYYIELSSKGARLPKFTRWITGMWADNKEFAKIMAEEGQKAATRKIMISVSPIDILRCADTPHFTSCFAWKGASIGHRDASKVRREEYHRLPATILEECPGIALMYVDDDKCKMMGRHWIHHAKLKDTGEDIVVLTDHAYGCLRGDYIAKLLAQRGVKVGITQAYRDTTDGVPIEYVGCFTTSIHHDVATWAPNPRARIVKA